jgi:hypothetical protein
MTAIDNPKIGSSTAVATTAMITPTDRGTRRTPIRPFRCRAHRDMVPVALSPGYSDAIRSWPELRSNPLNNSINSSGSFR